MKNIFQNNYIRYGAILILLLSLISVRFFEKELFYDPFLFFFKSSDYQNKPMPEFETMKLLLNITFRYFLNSLFSIGIIYLLFREKYLLRFTTLLFVALFFILIVLFLLLTKDKSPDYLALFYVRRFLIQPLFLILFIPALYYNKVTK